MPTQIRGISGIGNITSLSQYNKVKDHVVMWRFRIEWADIETSAGVFDWSSFEDDIDIVVGDDKYFCFQINISPSNASSTTPLWLFSPPYNVPKVTTDAGQSFPYYLDATFMTRWNFMLDTLRNRIENVWSPTRRNKLVFWQSAEGKTGDEGPYKGNVVSATINGVAQLNPSIYKITDAQWSNYKRSTVWPNFTSDLAADIPTCLPAINPSNDATDWRWGLDNIADVCLKIGQPSHNYNNIGEYFYALRCNAITSVVPDNMLFGEFENLDDLPEFQSAPKQNMFAQLCSFMTHGTTSMNISIGTFNNVIDVDDADDWWMFDFANEVMGIRSALENNKAWIVFRDIVDGADLVRFPENQYDQLVSVTQWAAYNNKYQQVYNSSDSQEVKNDKYAALLLQYFNDARRVNIAPDVPNLNLEVLDGSNDHDMYNQDFIIYGLTGGNYGKFMTQYNPSGTSTGYARIGDPVTETHGRTCRAPNNEILVAMDTGLMPEASYTVDTVDIYYYDESNRSWSFNYYNASSLTKTPIEIVSNTGTNTWLKKTYTIPNMLSGGYLANNTDWSLKTESGNATKFSMVYFSGITQNSNIIPIGGSKSNSLTTICNTLSEPFYTQGAFTIGKILYTDPFIATPLTGYVYWVETNSGTIYNIDSATGEVLSLQGSSCGVGTQGIYVLGNTIGIICGGDEVILYTNGAFGVGKVLAYNSNLFDEVTGYTYVVNTADNKIYNLNSTTGEVLSDTGSNCTGSGIAGTYKTGNNLTTICGLSTGTLYTDGQFTIGSFLFTDINLLTPATGFSYIVNSNNFIYSVNSGTGQVLAQVGICNGGTSGSFRRSNSALTVCTDAIVTLYTSGEVLVGNYFYIDVNLVTPLTGYAYVVDDSTDAIYSIDSLTGEILAQTGTCSIGLARTVRLGNVLSGVCALSTETVYTENPFGTGETLYYDINLTNLVRYYDYVVDTTTSIVYNLNDTTGVVGTETGIVCGSGISGSYRLGDIINSVCTEDLITLYTDGAFAVGKTLYEDINLTTVLSTPYLYVVDESTGYIYELYNSVVGDVTTGICGGGIIGTYNVSNVITAVCVSGTPTTLYTRTEFAVGVFLFTDINLLTPFTGYTYIVNPANDYIYIINPSTGEVLSQTNFACSAENYETTLADDFSVEVAKYIVYDEEDYDIDQNQTNA